MKYIAIGLSILIMLLVPALALARAEQTDAEESLNQGQELKERAQNQLNKATDRFVPESDIGLDGARNSDDEDGVTPSEETTDEVEESTQPVGSPRSQMARERMSVVAKQVESLLADPDREGGIGEQVREVAREQQAAEVKTAETLDELDAQPGFLKFLFGADPEQVRNLQRQVEQNRERIRVMRELADQPNAGEAALQLQNTARALESETEELDTVVSAESSSQGVLSWLRQLLATN